MMRKLHSGFAGAVKVDSSELLSSSATLYGAAASKHPRGKSRSDEAAQYCLLDLYNRLIAPSHGLRWSEPFWAKQFSCAESR